MGFPWRQSILFLVIVIAILQVIHISLLSRLDALRNERRKRSTFSFKSEKVDHNHQLVYSIRDIERDRKSLLDAVRESSVLDAFGEMHIINNWIKAESLGHRNHLRKDITLVTQTSLSELHNLLTIIHRWKGLISVGLFTLTEKISTAIEIILLLRKCYPIIRYNTSFHLVYPLHVPPPDLTTHNDFYHLLPSQPFQPSSPPTRTRSFEEAVCSYLPAIMSSLNTGNLNYENEGTPFPNNLLRNVARRNSLTQFIFVTDIDLVPSVNLDRDFIEFATENRLFEEETKDEKTVYVVPSYEIDSSLVPDHIPKDKTELMLAVNSGYVRPFYYELCWKCQKYTDYEAWQKESKSSKLNILFEVFWHDPWEPFYISRNTVPMYDERFRQYGFNRISQVCELHMAGYRFSVLNNPFVVHKGMKRSDSFHKDKDLELEKNRILFRHFKNELKDRYPLSARRCY